MSNEEPPLFYLEEPKFGCSQPVRRGDIVRVKEMGHGWRYEGMPFLVTGVSVHLKYNDIYEMSPAFAVGIICGKEDVIGTEYLEAL